MKNRQIPYNNVQGADVFFNPQKKKKIRFLINGPPFLFFSLNKALPLALFTQECRPVICNKDFIFFLVGAPSIDDVFVNIICLS